MAEKRFYWLKLSEDFFKSRDIKKLRKIAGGDTYTIIYLKLLLLSLTDNGYLYYEGVEPTFAEEMALAIDEDEENVEVTLSFLEQRGLLERKTLDEYILTACSEMTGSEASSTRRSRLSRAKKALAENEECCNATPNCQNATSLQHTATKCNTEIDIDIDKEIDIEKIEKRKNTNYQEIISLYNEICISFPRVKVLSEARKKAIKARLNIYTIEDFKTLFEKAEASDFLKGKNNHDWSANFDWLIADRNMAKTLDGNYDNKTDLSVYDDDPASIY